MNTLMRSEIWCSINIGDLVLQSFTGLVRSAREQNNEKKFNYLKMNNLNFSGDFDLNNLVKVDATKAEVQRYSLALGDFIFNTRNSVELVGKCGVFSKKTNEPLLFNNNLLKIRFIQIDPRLVSYWLNSPLGKHDLRMITSATTSVAAIYQKKLFSLKIPLPPLAEQKIIADKLDTLLAQVETTKARLDRIPEILKTFRQSVLAAAVSGKLTEEWRVDNEDKIVLDSDIFLVHKDKWERVKLKEFIEKSKQPANEKWRQKYKCPECVEPDKTWTSPSSWAWTTIDSIASVTKLAGFEFTKYVNYSSSGEIPVLKAQNVGKDGFKVTQYSKVPLKTVELLPRSELFGDEILITFVGAGVGQVARVPTDQKYFLGPNIAVVRNTYDQFESRFLELLLSSNEGKRNLLSFSKGAAQPSLSMGQIRQTTIPLPHKDEQTEIVRRVEELFAFADSIEQKTNAALERVNNLTQSILAKAFRGELTADWRAENPDLISGENSAEALLAIIQAEREKLALEKKAANKTRKKKA
ncbi:MAG: restriction endonuclease subunit S [Thalassolituus sp.]|jgi:type I restriction enzyme S subunit